MAADIHKILANLFEFYDFNDKVIISVGAGGGQFIEYGRNAKKVIAVDNDLNALNALEKRLANSGLTEKFTLVYSDFDKVKDVGDVVMFEFCLHEMTNPKVSMEYAFTLAPEVLITDHWPQSDWAYIVDETEKVNNSWAAVNQFKLSRIKHYGTVQLFENYEELYKKVKVQGDNSIQRIDKYRGKTGIKIPMKYGFALVLLADKILKY